MKKATIQSRRLASLILVLLAPSANALAADTPLDVRRINALRQVDAWFILGAQDASYPQPNRTLTIPDADSRDYLAKSLAIFSLIQQEATSPNRVSEANQLLRYMIHRFPVASSADIVGQYGEVWNHRARMLSTYVYYRYRDLLAADVRQEFDRRMLLACTEPYNQSSENLRATSNALTYLAHEMTGNTSLPSFANVRTWWINFLRDRGNDGFYEWATPYQFLTLGAILNLAELAEDVQVRDLATMVVDYTLGCMAGFSIDGYFNSAAVRRHYWTFCMTDPHTQMLLTLFYAAPDRNHFLYLEWAASNYRPPTAVEQMCRSTRHSETRLTLMNHRWHIRSYVMDRVAISTHQTLVDNYYGSPDETHDIVQCVIQSVSGDTHHLTTYAIKPDTKQFRCTHDRSFGYHNVALVNGGGYTRKAWAAHVITEVPIRLYYSEAFTPTFSNGWAFLTDGDIYVAWAPTIGSPVTDPESATFALTCSAGTFLRSDYTPTDLGEAAVVEVGDPESFGSYTDFQNEILSRNPRPRWAGNKVVYTARDGAVLEFGTSYAKVNGIPVDLAQHPEADSPLGIQGKSFVLPGQTVQFDFDNIQVSSPLDRLDVSRIYGPGSLLVQAPYGGVPVVLPGLIQAENYDIGGETIAYHDTTWGNAGGQYRNDDVDIYVTSDVDGGYSVGNIAAGEWLEYTVDVPVAAGYSVDLRVAASPAVCSSIDVSLALDGTAVTGTLSWPPTAGEEDWKTVSVNRVSLPAGQHVFRINAESGGWNLNWIRIRSESAADFDLDDDVDQSDFGYIQACLSQHPGTIHPGCQICDLNGDGTVNNHDLDIFMACMSGPGRASDCR